MKTPRAIYAVPVALALALAACGNDEPAETTGAAGSSDSASPLPAEPDAGMGEAEAPEGLENSDFDVSEPVEDTVLDPATSIDPDGPFEDQAAGMSDERVADQAAFKVLDDGRIAVAAVTGTAKCFGLRVEQEFTDQTLTLKPITGATVTDQPCTRELRTAVVAITPEQEVGERTIVVAQPETTTID